MATAPGSESLPTTHRGPTSGDSRPAGPHDSEDPRPRAPDDTPHDARTGALPVASPAVPGAREVTVEADIVRDLPVPGEPAMRPPVA